MSCIYVKIPTHPFCDVLLWCPLLLLDALATHHSQEQIITGFLGAGKTSLLNYLLKEKGDKRIAVIENEFGEVNIDRELVSDNLVETEDLVSLENGCVCCSLRKDIVKAFADIEQRAYKRGGKPDAILLETTGLADPAPVAFTFFANPWVASRFKLDSILCVVDPLYLRQHVEDGCGKAKGAINEAVQQLAFADLILLNKIDLVTAKEIEEVKKSIRVINTSASIVECQLNDPAKCPAVDQLLNVNSFSVSKALEVDNTFLDSDSDTDSDTEGAEPVTEEEIAAAQAVREFKARRKQQLREAAEKLEAEHAQEEEEAGTTAREEEEQQGPESGLEQQEEQPEASEAELLKGSRAPRRFHKTLHDLSDVSSVAITATGQLDSYRFNMFMRDLLQERAKDVFRSKGVLAVHGQGNMKFIFQGVHETICYGPADQPWKEGEPKINRIVFIGRKLDRKALIEGFRTCIWVPLPEGWDEHLDPKTSTPFYVEVATGKKTWARPDAERKAEVVATHASTRQPAHARPSGDPVMSATSDDLDKAEGERQVPDAEPETAEAASVAAGTLE